MSQTEAEDLLEAGYAAFREGDNEQCVQLTTQALDIGTELESDEIVGHALAGLCRAALRDRDEERLENLCEQLRSVSERSGDENWQIYRFHMRAEMARINGDLAEAEELYERSLQLSEKLDHKSMVASEFFNRSLVAVERDDLTSARSLIQQHFELRNELDEEDLHPYGLIAIASLLKAEDRLTDAAAVASACRRMFDERDIVPDPADEKPLSRVEERFQAILSDGEIRSAETRFTGSTCGEVVESYLDQEDGEANR